MDKIALFHASHAEPMAIWSEKEKEKEKNTALQDPHVIFMTHTSYVCVFNATLFFFRLNKTHIPRPACMY
jgi:hypothetical protein